MNGNALSLLDKITWACSLELVRCGSWFPIEVLRSASETTQKFFEARVAVMGFKSRQIQLQGEVDRLMAEVAKKNSGVVRSLGSDKCLYLLAFVYGLEVFQKSSMPHLGPDLLVSLPDS